MLKSRDRTKEVSVMGTEGWSQVVCKILKTFGHTIRISSKTKKVTQFIMKGVMPYAKKEHKNALRKRPATCRILRNAKGV